jgi:predicted transposase YbfD/YdcC
MKKEEQLTLMRCFAEVEDPRIGPAQLHNLEDILTIAICGVICGANDWVNIELFGQAKEAWLKTILELPNGIPSHDTFGRVFRAIDPEQFEQAFMKWIMSIQEVTEGEVVAIDGKSLRRSHDGLLGKDAIWMVDAWVSENQVTLGQLKVAEKSNEITAIPKLLELLMIKGCIVTIDAIGCQTKITEKIIEAGADYVLAVKENQGILFREMEWLFELAKQVKFEQVPHEHIKTVSKHGRLEIRECWSISDGDYIDYLQNHQDWKGLKTIAVVETEFRSKEKITRQRRY